MKRILKTLLITACFLFGNFLFAVQPPNIGHFKGLAFSSATNRHAVEIIGGNLIKCENESSSLSDTTRCEVENGSVVVGGSEWNTLNVKLTRVSVLRTTGETPTRNYYFRGTTDLMVGAQSVTVEAKVTLTVKDSIPNRTRGFIDLPEQYARTSLEAYLVR